jgi:hypothetical protein
MPPMGFEPKVPTGERPQTYALDRAVTGTDTANIKVQYLLLVDTKSH